MDKRIYLSPPHMGGNEQKYINRAFEKNWITCLGENVDEFESNIKKYVDIKGALALSSGTAAIHLALKYLGVCEGDFVFCSSLTFSGSCNPIMYEKAIPVFIDSDEDTFNMSPLALERAFSTFEKKGKLPKAVVIVNLYGQSADYDKLLPICQKYNVPIVEDAAESLGTTYKGKQTGTFGDIGIFSFNGNKIITTSGGGMAVSNNLDAISKCKFWSTQSRENFIHYEHKEVGYNYRMSNVLAGIGIGQLEVLNDRIKRKKEIFNNYKNAFDDISEIKMMPIASFGEPNYWLSVITIDEKSKVSPSDIINKLDQNNVESRPVWKPMHMQPVFCDYEFFSKKEKGSISKDLFEKGVCLPSGTAMTLNEQDYVIDLIKNLFK